MNKLAKGKRTEREISEFLEEKGYSTYRPAWNRYSNKDIFNKFDIIAIRQVENEKQIVENFTPFLLFLQVKSNRTDFYKARKQVATWYFLHEQSDETAAGVILKLKKGKYRLWYLIQDREYDVLIYG